MSSLPTLMILLALGSSTLLVLPSGSERAYACEVTSLPATEEAFDSSAAVFSGKVADIQKVTLEDERNKRLVFFEVDRYWKVPNENDYEELIVFTEIDHGACGYDFETGKSYLVYAIMSWPEDGSLTTSIGTRTQPLDTAQEDLDLLGEGAVPTRQVSWDEQLDNIVFQPIPTGQEQAAIDASLSIVAIGTAIAGTVAFFSFRRLKDKRQ